MNGQRVFDFLNWSITDHTDETLFEGVFQLRGGQYSEIQLRTLSLRKPGAKLDVEKWYNLDPAPFNGDFNTAVDRIRTLLTKSVDIHLRADVPIGSCLSGGLDSSAIVCLANKSLRSLNSESLQKTFSACVKVKHLDERKFMEEVVKATGVQAHFVYPTSEDLFNTYKQIGWHQDEPFGSSSIHAQWTIFKLAAENNVKVMLDGQGADEQLAGYHNFFGPYFAGLFKRGRWLRLFTEMRATKILHKHSYTKSIKWIGNMLLPEGIRQSLRGWNGKANSRPNWINFEKLGANPGDPFTDIGFKSSSIRDFSVAQLSASNLQMLLHWEDRDSMAHSIESRVPFLDHEFVECVVSLPDSFKLKAGVTKRVLRSAMAEALPPSITHRMDKLGFVTPEEFWLREEATEKFRDALISAIENSEGILNQNILATFEEIVAGRRPFSQVIWRVISFGAWMETFKVTAPYK
ncbi:MAG: asparagine synthase [Proteobacteria bacterium]|nr:MAG: asparagine synthase [Pseudomonadota bacterium]